MSFCPKYEESWGGGVNVVGKKKFPPKSGIIFFFFNLFKMFATGTST